MSARVILPEPAPVVRYVVDRCLRVVEVERHRERLRVPTWRSRLADLAELEEAVG